MDAAELEIYIWFDLIKEYGEKFEQHNEIRRIGEATYSIYNPYSQFSEKVIKQQTNNKRQQRNWTNRCTAPVTIRTKKLGEN